MKKLTKAVIHSLALLLLLGGIGPSNAVALLSPSTFNATDGNLLLDNTEVPAGVGAPSTDDTDWETFSSQIDCSVSTGCVLDIDDSANDDHYTFAAKEDDVDPAIDTGPIPPSLTDLTRWYFVEEFVGTDTFLYLAWVRSNSLGSAFIDFELNQSSTMGSNGVTPVRTEGDVLITFEFPGDSQDVQIDLYRWLTAAGGHINGDCEAFNGSLPCWGNMTNLSANSLGEGAVNFYDDGGPPNKYSVVDPINGSIGPRRFGEAAVNLTGAIVTDPSQCLTFTHAHVKARGTTSFNAELKDFIAPVQVSISTCTPIVDILDFFDDSVENLSLEGSGPGKSADGRLQALRNMLESAGNLIAVGDIDGACAQLIAALGKCDGEPVPPDFVSGSAAEELKDMIMELIASLGCST